MRLNISDLLANLACDGVFYCTWLARSDLIGILQCEHVADSACARLDEHGGRSLEAEEELVLLLVQFQVTWSITHPITVHRSLKPGLDGVIYRPNRPNALSLSHDSEELVVLQHRSEAEVWHLEDEVGGLESEGEWWGRRGSVCDHITAPMLAKSMQTEVLDIPGMRNI